MTYIHQLFVQGKFKSEEQVSSEFGLSKLRFNSLKSAMPDYLKVFFMEKCQNLPFFPLRPHKYDVCVNTSKSLASTIYKELNGDMSIINGKYLKWIAECGDDFVEGTCEFGQLHKDVYSVTNIVKFRKFSI